MVHRLQDIKNERAKGWPRVVVPTWHYRNERRMDWYRQKISEIKMVRQLTGLGLKGAKDLVEIGVDTSNLVGMVPPSPQAFYSVPFEARVAYQVFGASYREDVTPTKVGSVLDYYTDLKIPFTLFELKGAAR